MTHNPNITVKDGLIMAAAAICMVGVSFSAFADTYRSSNQDARGTSSGSISANASTKDTKGNAAIRSDNGIKYSSQDQYNNRDRVDNRAYYIDRNGNRVYSDNRDGYYYDRYEPSAGTFSSAGTPYDQKPSGTFGSAKDGLYDDSNDCHFNSEQAYNCSPAPGRMADNRDRY